MGVLIAVLVVAVVALGVWWSCTQAKKRREALLAFARQNGLQYSREDPFGLLGSPFPLLHQGDGRGCENVLSGVWQGLPVKEADYWYYTESTDSEGHTTKDYHYFSIAIADLPCSIPEVAIEKEGVLGHLADHLGFQDIQFESEDFNRAFRVKGRDAQFAYKLVDARMMQWLLATSGEFAFHTNGGALLVSCRRRKPGDLLPLLGTAKLFAEHIPSLVLHDYGSGAATPAPPAT